MLVPTRRNGKRRETPVSRRISSRPTARSQEHPRLSPQFRHL
jgi:hypothetical protein